MHRSLLLLGVMVTFLGACGGGKETRNRNKVGKLSQQEYDRLEELNKLQQENMDARDHVMNFAPTAISEKSKAMGEKLAQSCRRAGDIPENDMNGAVHEETIDGTGCPIYWFRRRTYSVTDKLMNIADNLVIESDDYRKNFSALHSRNYAGTYKVTPDGAGFRVSGVITFNEFSTVNYGRLQGTITLDHKNVANEGGGYVTLSVSSVRGWKHLGSIAWNLRRGAVTNIIYRIDSAKVEREDFQKLFSAYELDKIMDNALRMK